VALVPAGMVALTAAKCLCSEVQKSGREKKKDQVDEVYYANRNDEEVTEQRLTLLKALYKLRGRDTFLAALASALAWAAALLKMKCNSISKNDVRTKGLKTKYEL
jgi:hypothetical protein